MKKIIFLSIFLFTSVCNAEIYQLDHDYVIFIEPGDTLTELFGKYWYQIAEVNKNTAFYDKNGRLLPDKILTGTRLKIPAGSYVRHPVIQKINKYNEIRNSALIVLKKAEKAAYNYTNSKSEVYIQGLQLLKQAKNRINGITYGFANYIEAEKLLNEALRCFKINDSLSIADNNTKRLKNEIEKHNITTQKKILNMYIKITVLITLTLLMTTGLFFYLKHKRKEERIIAVKSWLDGHISRINFIIQRIPAPDVYHSTIVVS